MKRKKLLKERIEVSFRGFLWSLLLSCLFSGFWHSLPAQVTIGGLQDPAKGAILDLNSTVRGGLVLSNVEIKDIFTIPAEIPAPSGGWDISAQQAFSGSLVYHTGGNNIPTGVCYWNGERWIAVACTYPAVSPAENDPPLPVSKIAGESASFSVSGSGTGISYCWYKDGSPVAPPATSNTLAFSSLVKSDEGSYYSVVTGACGSVQSGSFGLIVCEPAVVSPAEGSPPSSVRVDENGTETFTVTASGTGITYQWYKDSDSSPLSGKTGNTLVLNNLQTTASGTYYCRVSGQCGSVRSADFGLNVCTLPGVSAASSTAVSGMEGGSASLSVSGSGTGISYQWYKNGTLIPDATNSTAVTPTLSFNPLALSDAGTYYCVVSSSCSPGNPATSVNFTLTVTPNVINMPVGTGSLSGQSCFDIGATDYQSGSCGALSSRTSHSTNFASGFSETYTFTATTNTVKNVRFYITEGSDYVLSTSAANPVSGALSNGSSTTFTVTYRNDLNTALKGRDRSNPGVVMLYVVYNNNTEDVSLSLRITIQDCSCCGAYLKINNITEWRTFMCHNLGATESADPFTPSYQINGAYYRWGAKGATAPAPGSANPGDDGSISTWNTTNDDGKCYGDCSDGSNVTFKSTNDPCPGGYRVPSYNEWEGLYNYYTNSGSDNASLVSKSGSWDSSGSGTCVTCFSGKNFGGSLFLPAAGYRRYSNGTLSHRGYGGYYWSTRRGSNASNAYNLNFDSGYTYASYANYRADGFSVRCIAE
jgi:uncharacterized protein (TIGR02145 family)